jgi:hypothetical protein
MSHAIWYDVPFTCLNCGSTIPAADTPVHSPGLNPETWDLRLAPGQTIELDRSDFDDAFQPIGEVSKSEEIRALEDWSCPVCGAAQVARLVFAPVPPGAYRLVSAQTVPMTMETVREANMASPRLIDTLRLDPDKNARLLEALKDPAA